MLVPITSGPVAGWDRSLDSFALEQAQHDVLDVVRCLIGPKPEGAQRTLALCDECSGAKQIFHS
jgi:hypothetical protein